MSVSRSPAVHHLGHGNIGNRRLTSALLPESCRSLELRQPHRIINMSFLYYTDQKMYMILFYDVLCMCANIYIYINLCVCVIGTYIIMATSSAFIIADIQQSDTSPEVIRSKVDKALAEFSTLGSVWQQGPFSINNSQDVATPANRSPIVPCPTELVHPLVHQLCQPTSPSTSNLHELILENHARRRDHVALEPIATVSFVEQEHTMFAVLCDGRNPWSLAKYWSGGEHGIKHAAFWLHA